MIGLVAMMWLTAGEPSVVCMAAVRRLVKVMEVEAKGTRHEAQIAEANQRSGGRDATVRELAATLSEDQCDKLAIAPDAIVREMAIGMLPERQGK